MKRLFVLVLSLLFAACAKPVSDLPLPSPAPTPTPYTVVLDFGHGGFDGGAVGVDTGVVEADLNLAVGKKVQAALEQAGCRVLLTRPDEHALGDTKNADMHARGELLKNPEADCTVSIHMNKFSNRRVSGPMAFYQAGADEGQRLASCVISAITDALALKSRNANPANNFVTRVPSAPSVLVECGFLSNPTEEKKLQEEAYQQTLAEAIAKGVLTYLDGRATPAPLLSEELMTTIE